MTYRRRLKRHLNRCVTGIKKAIARLLERTGEWWQWHWSRIAEEHGYAEALTAVLVKAVELLSSSLRIRYAAHELLAVHVAILRTLRRSNIGEEPV